MTSSSANDRRMARYKKFRKKSSLNLVSLMDIFTILVFFLLVSSGNTQKLPNSKDIKLPTSIATKSPKETIIIAVTNQDILVDGRRVALVNNVLLNKNLLIPGLEKELRFLYSKSIQNNKIKVSNKIGRAVTIMGDEKIPYELLSKILATCRQANYTQIAFATMQEKRKK